MLFWNLIISGVMVLVTFGLHFAGLVGLSAFMKRRGSHPANLTTLAGQGASIIFIVLALFALHSIEIWLYAGVYLGIGAFDAIEPALYFSTSTFTTVGFGDLFLEPDWRMLAAAESMNGFLLIGWSTAFLVSVTSRVRLFEADVERLNDD